MQVAFTWHNNVYLMNADGTGWHAVTTRETNTSPGISYPWYQWSPDGKYLLVVRQRDLGPERPPEQDILLMDQMGRLLRTLVTNLVPYIDFYPFWALDGDEIAYVASDHNGENWVDRVGVNGRKRFLWRYNARLDCGVPPFNGVSDMLRWMETGPWGLIISLQWRIAKHTAVYNVGSHGCSTIGPLNVTDTRTGKTWSIGPSIPYRGMWASAVEAPSGQVALVRSDGVGQTNYLVRTGLRPTAPKQILTVGELPVWSRDSQFLYFVRRTPGPSLGSDPQIGGSTFTSTIWRMRANGTDQIRLLTADAYGLGPLQLVLNGRSIIFSQIDNPYNLWHHHLPGAKVTNDLIRRYGPRTEIQRLDADGTLVTLAHDASRPEVQPSP